MTNSEKAKAYDEAIERAKKELNTCGSQDCDAARQIFRFFPELKESEDERIRQELIAFLIYYNTGQGKRVVHCDDWISWLEKQGETSPVLSNSSNIGKDAWSEEDKRISIEIKCLINNYRTGDDEHKLCSWIDNLKDRLQPQPKQEWSEYDKIQLSEAIQMIEANGTWIRSEDAVKKVSNWLKSLKPKSHWKPSEKQMKGM